MPIDQLVSEITKLVIPALPYLIQGIKFGVKKAAEKIGEVGSEKALDVASQLWNTIIQKRKLSRKFSIAVKELAKEPNDKTWRDLMKDELKSLLKENPDLVEHLSELLVGNTPEQSVRAVRNKKARISQSIDKAGRQKITASENIDIVIRQTIKKK